MTRASLEQWERELEDAISRCDACGDFLCSMHTKESDDWERAVLDHEADMESQDEALLPLADLLEGLL